MTPKEKAKELVALYCQLLSIRDYENKEKAKQCALIAVDEIQNLCWNNNEVGIKYWNEVKQEIEKL